jgi:hypothetical protein
MVAASRASSDGTGLVVVGTHPKISRDGRWLAYSRAPFEGPPGCTSSLKGIGIHYLSNVQADRFFGVDAHATVARPLSWSKRGRLASAAAEPESAPCRR